MVTIFLSSFQSVLTLYVFASENDCLAFPLINVFALCASGDDGQR